MSAGTNATDIEPQTRDPRVLREVRGPEDLPDAVFHAPSGVDRVPLELGVKYATHKTFVWPRLLWPATPGIGFIFTEIFGISQNVAMLVDGDADAHIWGRGTGNIRLNNLVIQDVSNGGAGFGSTLFDLVGQSTDIDPIQRQNALFITDAGLVGFADIGRVVDIGVAIQGSGWIAQRGLVARSVSGNVRQAATAFSHVSIGAPMKAPMLCYQGLQTVASLSGGSLALGPGDSSFCIDSAATGTYDFLGIPFGGAAFGNFFRPDIANPITEFAPADIGFASVQDSSVAPGVDSTIRFATIQKFVRGQVVLIDGVGATYDGTHTIVRVSPDEKGFDINVVFGATDTGDVKATRVTSVDHGLVGGETQTISGSTNYNQISEILFRVDDDNFDIPIAFVGDDAAGTVSSVSKNKKSIGVSVLACGLQQDSKSIGSLHATDNVAITTITMVNEWVDLNLDTAVVSSNIELWEMADAATGELRHLDAKEFEGWYEASITAMSSAAIEQFQFRVVVDDLPTSDGNVFGIELKANTESITVLAPVKLGTGGRARLQARNMDGTSNLHIQQLSVKIQ